MPHNPFATGRIDTLRSHQDTSSPNLMVFLVMVSAQRYREFVADLTPHRSGLGESQMVGVTRGAAASNTAAWLRTTGVFIPMRAKLAELRCSSRS